MLKTLHIENVAVIEKADIQFMAGFNVLTGETGAGKSIIIDSLWAILGARTSRELIRHGQNKAVVSALFSPLSPAAAAKAEELGFPPEDDTLLISREIVQDGRNTCRINGRPASVSILRQLGETLVNIHGQNAGIALLDENSHMDYLDSVSYTHLDVYKRQVQGCVVECSVILKYGSSVTETAGNLQKNVKTAIESMAGIKVARVDVQVCGIQLPKKQ